MKDEEVAELLRSLPAARPSPDFTTAVLERLDGRRPVRWWREPALLAVAVAGLLLLLAGLFVLRSPARDAAQPPAELAASRERVDRLRAEYERLEQELEELRLLSAESQPVIGVAGDDGVEYLFDLREVASRPDRAMATSLRTAY